jgi:hypothetical protein
MLVFQFLSQPIYILFACLSEKLTEKDSQESVLLAADIEQIRQTPQHGETGIGLP